MRRRGVGRFDLTVSLPTDIDSLSLEALTALVVQLLSKVAEQERLIAELREENARLKGVSRRPRIKPSGIEDAGGPKLPGRRGKHRRCGKIVPCVAIEDRMIKAQVPPGSRFKGYETFVVQDIVLRAAAIRYRRERWVTPDGTIVLVMRLLIAGQDGFLAENCEVLPAGLQTASWISVDDTGARHAGKNGFCTEIGNDDFAWFGTRTSN